MLFRSPIPFEIPDDVWSDAGAASSRAGVSSYHWTAYRDALSGRAHHDIPVDVVPIERIVPPQSDGAPRFLVPDRLRSVLRAIVRGETLPAVLGQRRDDAPDADVELVDGVHRFFASAALGLTHLPVAIRPYWEP